MSQSEQKSMTRKEMFGFESDDADTAQVLADGMARASADWMKFISTPQVSCDIYDATTTDEEHNCVACNLDDATQDICEFLRMSRHLSNQRLGFGIHLGLINSLWERMRDVFETIDVPTKMWNDNASRYASFKAARAWANFMKHPGFFAYGLHHPIYVVEDSTAGLAAATAAAKKAKDSRWCLIDTDFVRTNWTDTTGQKARKALQGCVTAAVLLPDPAILTQELCEEYSQFTRQICDNPDYVELLASASTARDVPCFWDEYATSNWIADMTSE